MFSIILPFVERDRHQAERLLNWMKELGGTQFPIYLLAPRAANPDGLLELARSVSPKVEIIPDREEIVSDWHTEFHTGRSAIGPNSIFRQCAMHFLDVAYTKPRNLGPFLFLEPDALPCQRGWDVKLDEEYQKCGKPFMGAYVPGGDSYPEHMSGVAIWPQQTFELASDAMRAEQGAFDVVGASQIVPKAHFTTSIVHHFRHKGFTSMAEVDELVKPETLIFHANKDGSLIPFLRKRIAGVSVSGLTVTQEERGTKPCKLTREGSAPSVGSNPATSTPPTVYTYYEQIEGRDTKEQEWMLAKWADSWRAKGWSPKVLGPDDAKTHPYYDFFLKKFMEFPTVNDKQYELACFIRWVAMVQVGGGVLTDYDVINQDFLPGDRVGSGNKFPLIMAANNHCPCGISGTAKQYDAACDFMAHHGSDAITIEKGRMHLSDQHLVQHFASEFLALPLILQYGQPKWETAKLVHFSSGSCQGRPRSHVIPAVLSIRPTLFEPEQVEVMSVKEEPKLSWIGQVRQLVARLDEMGDTSIRRHLIFTEMRKFSLFKTKMKSTREKVKC